MLLHTRNACCFLGEPAFAGLSAGWLGDYKGVPADLFEAALFEDLLDPPACFQQGYFLGLL
jgi:hypothetical protein